MKNLNGLLALSAMVVLSGQGIVPARAPAVEKSPPPVNHAVTANNDFAFDLYGQVASENAGKSLFFSPYSVSGALAIVAEGARKQTADEMGKVLRFPQAVRRAGGNAPSLPFDVSLIHTGLAALNKRFETASRPPSKEVLEKLASLRKALEAANLEAKSKRNFKSQAKARQLAAEINKLQGQVNRYEVRVANALWGEKTYPFKQSYLDTISKHYGTDGAYPVDFRKDYEGARKRINAWVEQQTKERIKNLIPMNALDQNTRLVVANAIYFKGEWTDPFSAKATRNQPFTLTDGARVQVPTMQGYRYGAGYAAFSKGGTFFDTPTQIPENGGDPKRLYPDHSGFEMLELPYKGGELSLVVIVPRSADGLPAVEKMLAGAKLQEWIGKLRQRTVQACLPKFKLETSFNLNKPLQKLGMKRAFNDPRIRNGAQFGGMTDSKDPMEQLYIAKVLHKAFVEVSEKGTEAAAATAVIMAAPTSARVRTRPFIPEFKAERPFVFLIRDRQSGCVLFLGRVMNPRGNG